MERTLTGSTGIDLRGEVTPQVAEEVIARLAELEVDSPVRLCFLGYPYMTPGSGWRIGNALRRFSGEGLEAVVPPFR